MQRGECRVSISSALFIAFAGFLMAMVFVIPAFGDTPEVNKVDTIDEVSSEKVSIVEDEKVIEEAIEAPKEESVGNVSEDAKTTSASVDPVISPAVEPVVEEEAKQPSSATVVEAASSQGDQSLDAQVSSDETYIATHQDMFRLYNPYDGQHLYTADFKEAISIAEIGWRYEGVGWVAPKISDYPVFRLYNPYSGDHHFTLDYNEYATLATIGWNQEGIGWYSDSSDQVPLYRQFNPYENVGTHNYTTDANEDEYLGSVGWWREGVAWYATRGDVVPVPARFLTTASWGSLNTYWIDPSGSIAKSRLITTSEGLSYCAYAGSDGSISKGQITDSDGVTYLCDANGVVAPTISATAEINTAGLTQKFVSMVGNNAVCIFLPSYATLSKSTLSVANMDGSATSVSISGHGFSFELDGNGRTVDLSALDGDLGTYGTASFTMRYLNTAYTLTFMKSASIAAMYVNSKDPTNYGRSYVEASPDHTVSADVKVSMVDADGINVYSYDTDKGKTSTIKGRGNSTWGNSFKKPYQVKLKEGTNLLTSNNDKKSADANKKWVLLAGSNDATLLHTAIGYDAGLELGLSGCEGRFVDLYYDGEYRGTYYLCEKVEINDGRVDINDLEKDLEKANPDIEDLSALPTATGTNAFGYTYKYSQVPNNPSDISGGYLLELDWAYYEDELNYFITSVGPFVLKGPEACSKECLIYISEYTQKALNKLAANTFNSGESFDLDSLAKTYLASEFFKNIDAFLTSTYFYKEKGDTPLIAAPLWDYDASMGVRTDWPDNSFRKYEGFTSPHARLWIQSQALQDKVKRLYASIFSPLMHNVLLGDAGAHGSFLHSIAYYRGLIARSQVMNQALFGITSFGNELAPFASYDMNARYLRNWITYRTQWWDANYQTLTGSSIYNPSSVYEDRDFSDVYDYYYYVANNPDVAAFCGGDPELALWHFVTYGIDEGRVASANFNVWTYRDMYGDLQAAFGDNIGSYYYHFIDNGFKEGRYIV